MAIKYYAGNKLTGVASDTKPTSNIIDGSTYFVTDTEDLFMYDLGTTAWKVVSGNTIAETLSNKTFSDHIIVAEISAPSTPASGYGSIYAKSDNKLYFKNDAGTEVDLTNQASGGESNQNAFSTVAVSGQSDVVADTATDTLTLVAGSNMTITTAAGSDTVTFAASGSGTVTITDNENTAENNLITFVSGAATTTGAHGLEMDGDLHYNPSTGTLTSTVFVGALTGNASGTAATVTGAAQTAITSIGTLTALQVDNLNINANTISATSGALNITPAAGSAIVLDGLISIDNGVVTGATSITSTAFVGALTGNASGTAATVTGAAQTAITSVGTLTGLDLTSGDKTIFATVGNNTLTVGASNTTVNIAGDLTVGGDATTFNTATISVEDPLMILASNNNAADAVDIGFYGLYDTSGSLDLYSGIFRDASDSGKWKLFKDLQAAPTTTVNTSGTGYAVGTLVANVEGNSTTATTLATARTIGGTSFDGSANIAVALAASATILATARTIGGTSFDGSAAIVPATITVADTTDTTAFVALFESATGDLAPKTDAGITYNAGTGTLTATAFVGPITGNVTGNASGTAATVTGATQAAITSAANLATVGTIGTGVWNGTALVQAYIGDQAINEAKLQVSNGPTNGYLLTARSGATGGMTWEASSSSGASESFAIAMAVAL
jgi:hypothetical protein